MKAFFRSVLAVFLGMLVGGLVVAAVETFSRVIFPLPPGIDPHDYEAMKKVMADFPLGAFLFVLLAWGGGTFAGAWVAARLAPRTPTMHGLIIGALFLLSGISIMVMIPHPVWFWIVGILIFFPAAYGGAALVAKRSQDTRSK